MNRQASSTGIGEGEVFAPAVDIEESEGELVLWADVPGASEDDLEITLDKGVLTIAAAVPRGDRPSYHLAHREYGVGDYRRVFTLSDSIDQDGIEASLKNGVLKLTLPKSVPARPRQIQINAS